VKIIDFIKKILDIFYPPICLICGRMSENNLCNKCILFLNKQLVLGVDNYISNKQTEFDEHMYLFTYEGIIRKLILEYKFNDKPYLNKIFVKILKKNKKTVLFLKKYDIIIPVPISKKRMRQRGYNQCILIAREISKCFDIQYNDRDLLKNKDTQPQSILSKELRKENVKDVYIIKNKEKLIDKKVLLVDDIFTTGSTVNECSKILIQAGVKSVGILTIAKD